MVVLCRPLRQAMTAGVQADTSKGGTQIADRQSGTWHHKSDSRSGTSY